MQILVVACLFVILALFMACWYKDCQISDLKDNIKDLKREMGNIRSEYKYTEAHLMDILTTNAMNVLNANKIVDITAVLTNGDKYILETVEWIPFQSWHSSCPKDIEEMANRSLDALKYQPFVNIGNGTSIQIKDIAKFILKTRVK